jgi:pilus assembly protein CpaF
MAALASYEAVREACFQRIMADGVLYEAAPDKRALVIQNVVGQYLYEMRAQLTRQERERLVRELVQDILAYGPITPLLDDERVTEIMVNGPS